MTSLSSLSTVTFQNTLMQGCNHFSAMANEHTSGDIQETGLVDEEDVLSANSGGFNSQLFKYDGLHLFSLPEHLLKGENQIDKLKKLKEVELDNEDIIICAYPKCGTHWLWEVLEMLNSGALNYRKESKDRRMIEFIFKEGCEAIPAPRIFNTHLPLRMLPTDVERKKINCIHIMRNPKDACVSFFHHLRNRNPPYSFEGTFVEFTENFLFGPLPYGCYNEYLLNWQTEEKGLPEVPTFNMYYEDMKKDPVVCIKQLAEFLNLTVTDKFCEDVAEACSFEKMKKDYADHKQGELFKYWKEGSGGTFYRKGETGEWKNWFTVAENEKFDRIWNEKMKNSGITFTYSLV